MKEILRARIRTCNTLKWLCRAPGVGFIGSRRRNDEGPGEKISRPFVQFGGLQDSNPPPDDYKAVGIVNDFHNLACFRVSKIHASAPFPALSGKDRILIGNASKIPG
ncbi:hypothetical protein [Burkholderia territorii]|uniref:hypothetical protein n=1 Tax=Burkholderia territorii TaxID=1503055 RepID=UPI0012D89C88|nr:hypothetical protein [Burkholderia territorii]